MGLSMELNTSNLLDFLSQIASVQDANAFLEMSLNEGLQLVHARTGMVVLFDYEEGQEAGTEAELLRRYLAYQVAQTRNTYTKLGLEIPKVNPLSAWLPKTSTVYQLPTNIQADRYVLVMSLEPSNSGQPIGFILILLDRKKDSNFTLNPTDQRVLNSFRLGVANSWLALRSFRNMTQRVDDLVLLTNIAALLTSNHDLPELLQQIMTTTKQMLDVEDCTLMLLDHATNELVFRVPDAHDSSKMREIRQPLGRGICGYVARVGRPEIVNEVANDERFNQNVDQMTGFHTRSVICTPMIVREKIVGVIEGINKRSGKFNNNDLSLLLTLSAQAAIAIENAELYSSLTTERDKLIAKEEEVRRDLGRDLHDGPAQVISAIAMRTGLIKKMLKIQPEQAISELDELEKVAMNTAKDIRTMMFGLRPLMLETKGLIATLEAYVEKLQTESWQSHLEVEGFKISDDNYRRLPHNVENTFFIIIQEAINNIRKHAQPRNVWIRLSYSEKETVVMVQDDGKGFDMESVTGKYEERGSFGLLNMRERARLVNASYYMTSKPGQGTTIIMTWRPEERSQIMTGPLSTNVSLMLPA